MSEFFGTTIDRLQFLDDSKNEESSQTTQLDQIPAQTQENEEDSDIYSKVSSLIDKMSAYNTTLSSSSTSTSKFSFHLKTTSISRTGNKVQQSRTRNHKNKSSRAMTAFPNF